MSTPASVLGEFWADLREKSRVRIEHPDLPADLGEAAGELIGTLWTRATASAQAELTALRDEVDASRLEAEQKVVAARDELGRTETGLEQRAAALLAAQVEIRELERQRAEEGATRKALEAEIKRLGDASSTRERELEKVRETFSRDLEKLRNTADRAEERLRATEKRAFLEMDRERSQAVKLQKELGEAAKRADKREAEHRRTIEALQKQQGDTRHENGMLQGKLAALEAANRSLQEQIRSLSEVAGSQTRRASLKEISEPVRRVAKKAAATKKVRAKVVVRQ